MLFALILSLILNIVPDARPGPPATSVSIPMSGFDSKENQYSTVADYEALIGPPAKDAQIGTGGQPIVQDHGLTPGDVRTYDKDDVCNNGTRAIRDVTQNEKVAVYSTYNKYYTQIVYAPGQYEVDHLVPLELGGSNSPQNLWPETFKDPWNAHIKDRLENYLHKQVCLGKIPLQQAQYMIAMDWINAYKTYIGSNP